MRYEAQASIVLSIAILAGCASQPPVQSPTSSTQGATLVEVGNVTQLRDVAVYGKRPSGIGSFVGAVLGGVAGSRIGSGQGSTVAGVGGAVAGSMAGQKVEQSGQEKSMTEVSVRFDNGDTRTYQIEPDASLRVGDAVKVVTSGGVTRITR